MIMDMHDSKIMHDIRRSAEAARRRTFAVISHPDAGKTTLTEKLLLFGGAIQLAGEVKAKKNRISTRSDWMAIERQRGISVVTSVMTFEYGGHVFNLLDTPGHADFSEDTYRTLTAVDSAIMVIDAAKGIEARTRKLFEVCRLRDIPIVTFINKMDREARDPFDLLDEIEKTLALDVAPMTWPVGRGAQLRRHLRSRAQHGCAASMQEATPTAVPAPTIRAIAGLLPADEAKPFQEEAAAGARGARSLSTRLLPRRPSDAGLLGLGAQELRRARSHQRAWRTMRRRRATSRRRAAWSKRASPR